MCTQVAAARHELVRELLRGRRSDLPLMLQWSCPSLSYGGRCYITIASLQLALGQGTLKFAPHDYRKARMRPEGEPCRWMVTAHPGVINNELEQWPNDVRRFDPVQPCAASEARAKVRPTGRFRAMHLHLLVT